MSSYNKLGNIIKSKIYGNYAIYKIKQIVQNNIRKKIPRRKSENIKGIYSRHISNYLNKHNFETFLPKKGDNDRVKKVKFKLDEKISLKEYVNEIDEQEKNKKRSTYNLDYLNYQENINHINHYLILATEFNNKSYKYWHNYAMFNYNCYKYYYNYNSAKKEATKYNLSNAIIYATNAINGLRYSLLMANKNKVRTLDDCLRFIDIFFELGNKNKNLLSLIESIINETNLEIFIGIVPQLTCRFDIKDQKILDILINLLSKLLSAYPEILLLPLLSIKNSKSKKIKSIANLIMEKVFEQNNDLKELGKEYEEFVNELNRCSFLYHEELIETFETCEKLYLNKEYNNMINHLLKMHKKMNKTPESLYEINFYQLYGAQLKQAEKKINKFLVRQNLNYLKEVWEIYQAIYQSINENYPNLQTISLQYVSSKLFNFKESNIIMPTFLESYINNVYENNLPLNSMELKQNFKKVTIKQIDKYLYVIESKQHPRKIIMLGSNNKQYIYLLKGNADLRQDERVIQIFNLVNLILAKENITSNTNLFITVYSVIPLSNNSGLIGWIHDCDSLDKLIKNFRTINKKIPKVELNILNKYNPQFESSKFLNKLDSFFYILEQTSDIDLREVIWLKSKDCESWFIRTTNYSRSLAVMSIVGYILGLGARHLNNLIMNRKTGKIYHLDFSNCFEVTKKIKQYQEKVPFRLTRMLVRALGITGVEGLFRITCEKILKLLRDNKDSLLAFLSAMVHNPLISFKLLIPLILEKQNNKFKQGKENNNIINTVDKNRNISVGNIIETNLNINYIQKGKNAIKDKSTNKKSKSKEKNKEENFEIKNERQMLEKEQRQIFNIFEESEDIDTDELYKIAHIVTQRINDKLNGTDFYIGVQLNEKEQVDLLIKEARSPENLATSYLGWEPFL